MSYLLFSFVTPSSRTQFSSFYYGQISYKVKLPKTGTLVQIWSMNKTHNYIKAPDKKLPPSLEEIPDFLLFNPARVWLHEARGPPAQAPRDLLLGLEELQPTRCLLRPTPLKTGAAPHGVEAPNPSPCQSPAACTRAGAEKGEVPRTLAAQVSTSPCQSPGTHALLPPP